MIQFNANINSVTPKTNINSPADSTSQSAGGGFSDAVKSAKSQLDKVNHLQQESDASIKDLLSGKNEDITSVVSGMAKADISFKLLVGVRNKLVEAYKETMNMPL